ncbi:CsbD family protein [Sodalis glossinidius]|uniref:CsbD family protein n=1 Tax=Sodalis glossinidius TaxID=63612 RepID=UPI001FB0DDCA|nr:CsbD family protein [Sodalis glossinidius]
MKEQWGKLTDDNLTVVEGKRDQLVGKIQERYGYGKGAAETEVKDWETRNKYRW